ncbi:zinc-binding dehydrogenase [Companilactobacillus sp. FL22-1]|uniref:zinc-binding dehydrogenase n=1 Tax=Companilactobacillus sp. FL22-1 TaxID=3373892 RepID=UPI003754DC8B
MQAYLFTDPKQSGLTNLRQETVSTPKPGPEQVLIKVNSIGLNPVDYKLISQPLPNFKYPHIFGLDAAGIVEAVGENVTRFKPGDRVSGHNNLQNDGVFAEYAIFPEYCLTKLPDNVSFETASALLCGAMTAYQAIFRKMNLTGKKNILIHAGAGGVGSIAIQLAKLQGLKVITTVSTAKTAFVEKFQPDKIIDYKNQNVTAEIMKYTNNSGVDLILNTVSGAEAKLDVTERLSYNGELVCIVDGPTLDDNDILFDKGLSVTTLNLGGAHHGNSLTQKKDLGIMAGELLQLASQKRIDPSITEVLPFDQLVDGLEMLLHRDSVGKIIVRI